MALLSANFHMLLKLFRYSGNPHGQFSVASQSQAVVVLGASLQRQLVVNVTRLDGLYGRVRVDFTLRYDQVPLCVTLIWPAWAAGELRIGILHFLPLMAIMYQSVFFEFIPNHFCCHLMLSLCVSVRVSVCVYVRPLTRVLQMATAWHRDLWPTLIANQKLGHLDLLNLAEHALPIGSLLFSCGSHWCVMFIWSIGSVLSGDI